MRLLNVKTKRVESFPNRIISDIPDYAILSHRWGNDGDEVTFDEMQSGSADIQRKVGYEKISKCCEMAAATGFEYVWIDTCCINKAKEYELTSTLASMFKWYVYRHYRDAQVCYTYLQDVSSDDNPFDEGSEFRRSSWFTRGWTLQELVAPLYVTFFDCGWNEIGTKSSLQSIITELTGIPSQVLLMNHGGIISVADRRLWAKHRKTSEPEDQAYALMGLLGVKIDVKYGEGEAALKKLDAEIDKLKGNSPNNPSSFDVSSWMRPEGEYRFFISIQNPPPKENIIEYPEVDGPTWAISEKEIELMFPNSGNCATIIFKNSSGLVFAICLGVHNYNVWCGMTTDCEHEDIQSISRSYWDGDKKSARWDNMDRRGVRLADGSVARLAIKKGQKNRKRAFFAEISAEGFWPEKAGPGVFPGWWTD